MNKLTFGPLAKTTDIKQLSARSAVAAALVLSLSACGGSDDDDPPIADMPIIDMPSGDITNDDPVDVDTTDVDTMDDDTTDVETTDVDTTDDDTTDDDIPDVVFPEIVIPSDDMPDVVFTPDDTQVEEDMPNSIVEQRIGLTVIYPSDTVLEELSSPFLAVSSVFQIAEAPDTTGDLSVGLFQYDEDFPFIDHVDFYENSQDVCFVNSDDTDENGEEGDGGTGPTLVSGGDNVLLTSAGNTFASVPFSEEFGDYFGDDILPMALPTDLILSVPGDVFPMGSIALNVPQVPQRLSPIVGDEITRLSEYRWVPDSNSSQIRLSFLSVVDGEFDGFPFTCFVEDDGEFQLPENVLAEIDQRPGELIVRYIRDLRILRFFNDNVAVQSSVSLGDISVDL